MFSAFSAPAKPKTTADVMSSFSNTLSELRQVEATHAAEVRRQEEIRAAADRAQTDALNEAQCAREVAAKLETLISPMITGDNVSLLTAQ